MRLMHRTRPAPPAPVWRLIHPMEWVPAYEWIITDPALIGPGLFRKTYHIDGDDSGAAITITTYEIRDEATGGYRVRVQVRCTHPAANEWSYWITRDMPQVFAEHLPWPAHDLSKAQDEAARIASTAQLFFPDLFAWDGDPASLYSGEGL